MKPASERAQYPLSVTVGITVAAVLCLWGAAETYAFESAYQQQNRDPYMISAQFVRLGPVESAVPGNAVMGYISDAQPGSAADSALLLSAQYVLAPRLLSRGAGQQRVLGNFTRSADFAAVGRAHGLRVEQDFGNGVVLFRRAP